MNFKDRLQQEFDELTERSMKLDSFMKSEAFFHIDLTQQILLKIQYKAMVTYGQCLSERLNLLK